MRLKIYSAVALCGSLFLILGGSSIQFLDSFHQDKKETLIIDQTVDQYYEKITKDMEGIHQEMTEMKKFFSLYYENIEENKKQYEEKFLVIKSMKKEIEENIDSVEKSCQNVVNESSKQKCKSLVENEKIANESYDNLSKTYDAFIESHAKWLENSKKVAMN